MRTLPRPGERAGSTTQDRLTRQIRGDLDAIVLKALAKSPPHRYGSAAGIADDLQRYLNGQPVKARPDRFTYRFGKRVLRRPGGWAVRGSHGAGCCGARLCTDSAARLRARYGDIDRVPVRYRGRPGQAEKLTSAVLPFVDMSERKKKRTRNTSPTACRRNSSMTFLGTPV